MGVNKTKLVVLAVSAGTIAFSSYYVYKTYKRVKEEQEEIKRLENLVEEEKVKNENEESIKAYTKLQERIATQDESIENFNKAVQKAEELAVESGIPVEEAEIYHDSDELLYMIEEGEEETLRHEPNSVEALNQFITMELSDIEHPEVLRIMDGLFRISISSEDKNQINPEDPIIARMIDNRYQFFGASRWTEDLSLADLLLNFAKMEHYDLDADIERSLHVYLENIGVYDPMEPIKYDPNRVNWQALMEHSWQYDGQWGIFGLDESDMDFLIRDRKRVSGNDVVMFNAEYNLYLESTIG